MKKKPGMVQSPWRWMHPVIAWSCEACAQIYVPSRAPWTSADARARSRSAAISAAWFQVAMTLETSCCLNGYQNSQSKNQGGEVAWLASLSRHVYLCLGCFKHGNFWANYGIISAYIFCKITLNIDFEALKNVIRGKVFIQIASILWIESTS